MAAQLRAKNRVFEPCKRVITPEVFEEVLEARKFAVARSAAKAHLKRIEESQLQATRPQQSAADAGSSQDSESRHHDNHEARPVQIGRNGNGATIGLDMDKPASQAVQQTKHDLRKFVKRQKAEAERLSKEAEKVQKEAERKLQSAAAEQARSNRLSEVDKERTILAKQIQEAEEEMKAVRHEMEPLNEQKAKLVMQLKQVLQAEEASRMRTSAASNLEEGEMLPSPSKQAASTAVMMETSR